MAPTFITPTVDEGPYDSPPPPFAYWGTAWRRGINVSITNGVATESRSSSVEEREAADYFYEGGRVYEISDAEADLLTELGYGEYIS